ncbi:MAG: FHA domain-containing protein [Ignavibacteriaceae bacterium]|jgi:hypothetical protein
MKCPSCKKENSENAKFCKYCGSPIGSNFRTCPNGHNYDANLNTCPYCPSNVNELKTVLGSGNEKTVLDSYSPDSDKTIIDSSRPTIMPVNNPQNKDGGDKTVILNASKNPSVNEVPAQSPTRKLVGWLVSFDITPNGTDFRLYEGRTKIGKKSSSDVVLNYPGVSEDHALILFRDNKFVIQDLLSTNGTFVNGNNAEDKIILSENDIIKIGRINFKLKTV